MTLFARLAALARSPHAKRMAYHAVEYARSPRGQEQIRAAAERARHLAAKRRRPPR